MNEEAIREEAILKEGEYLKCDTPSCDYFEMMPVVVELVGKPCPKCGASLLTQDDYIDYRKMKAGIDATNEVVLAANPKAPMPMTLMATHNGQVRRKNVEGQTGNPFPNSESLPLTNLNP
jgi:hypothetical protein